MSLDPAFYGLIPIDTVALQYVENFTCSDAELDRFLKVDAMAFHHGRIGYTTCVFHRDFVGMVGYFTLANDSIKLNDSEFMDLGLNIETQLRSIPSVKIGKFAVNQTLQRNGSGRAMVDLIIDHVLDEGGLSAARMLVLDARPDVVLFYERCHFVHSLHAEQRARHEGGGQTIKMYRDVLAGIGNET